MTVAKSLPYESRLEILEEMLSRIADGYVYPETAALIVERVRQHISRGDYAELDDLRDFCKTVTAHMQAVCGDKHLRLRISQPGSGHQLTDPERHREWAALQNHGFYRVERLSGNIGYLDLRVLHDPSVAGETAVAAMRLLANTSALLIDLRRCPGGSPAMVQLLTTYLFAEPVHLESFYYRPDDTTTQSWTLPYVPGERLSDHPVYVLTSSKTFSGGEEFAYNLKHLKRATIVGETTAGGAHPGDAYALPHGLEVFVPLGRPINPITGTNWEGTGVEPDIAVPAEQAFKTAYRIALEQVRERLRTSESLVAESLLAEVDRALADLDDRETP